MPSKKTRLMNELQKPRLTPEIRDRLVESGVEVAGNEDALAQVMQWVGEAAVRAHAGDVLAGVEESVTEALVAAGVEGRMVGRVEGVRLVRELLTEELRRAGGVLSRGQILEVLKLADGRLEAAVTGPAGSS